MIFGGRTKPNQNEPLSTNQWGRLHESFSIELYRGIM